MIFLGLLNVVSVSILLWDSFYGLCYRAVILIIFEFLLLYIFKPIKLRISFKFRILKKLFKTGFPIFIIGQIRQQWINVINNVIFVFGGATSFGYYALANIVSGAISVIPTAFSQVIFPRMALSLGEGKTEKEIINSNILSTFLLFIVLSMISFIAYWILPWFVNFLLPSYALGIEAAQWALFIPVALTLNPILGIYNVLKKQKWYYVSMITGVIIGSFYIVFQYKTSGFNLVHFPQGIIIGTLIQGFMGVLFLGKLTNIPAKTIG
jgi:O-antigen/teichoic acid export membrane protein